ncbi:hypothetical protein [Janthinobacterium sp. UMAB-56]|uniref:hypothetical protein n=1 Tax=Janthinobacterium sp. UMAB-56 TaxID=1365361 RepID=UPI001C584C5E|nr:hypothetical protein [Janthinobacterium sp. UMAB-56]
MANAESNAAVAALKLVTAGLQSGAITLHGIPVNHAPKAQIFGQADAEYLKALITNLTAAIKAVE